MPMLGGNVNIVVYGKSNSVVQPIGKFDIFQILPGLSASSLSAG